MNAQNLWTPTSETRVRIEHLELMRGGPAAACIPEHSHPEVQLSVRFRPKALGAPAAEVNLYAPHQRHSAQWDRGCEVVVWLLSNALMEQAADELGVRGRFEIVPVSRGRDGLLEAMGQTLLREFPPVRLGGFYFDSMAAYLAGYLVRRHSLTRPHQISSRQLTAMQMRALHAFLHERMESGFDVMELACSAGLPVQELTQRLKATTGLSPWAYVQRYRISMACRLLERRGLSLAEVAHRLGFASQSHFSNAFRSTMRTTPGAYRKRR